MKARTVATAAIAVGLLSLLPAVLARLGGGDGSDAAARAERLESEVVELRCRADFGAAAAKAEELAALLRATAQTAEYRIRDAERLIGTLKAAAALPPPQQEDLAEADRLVERIEALYAAGKAEEGIAVARRQLEIRQRLLGARHEDVARSLVDLAVLHVGEHAVAESLYLRALSIQDERLGREHPTTAATLSSLGSRYMSRAKYQLAESVLREALEIRTRLLGRDDPGRAKTLGNLADAMQYQGDYSAAEAYQLEALAIKRATLGESDPSYAFALGDLALVVAQLGDQVRAGCLYREALAILIDAYGPRHPTVAHSLVQLGMHDARRGDYESARRRVREALEICVSCYGSDHPKTANCQHNLALIERKRGELDEAERLYREAFATNEKHLGLGHPATLRNLDALASLRSKRGDYAAAESLLSIVEAGMREAVGESHVDVASARLGIAVALRNQGRYREAEPEYRRALDATREALGGTHPSTAHALRENGIFYLVEGDYPAAESSLREAAEAFEAARVRVGQGVDRVAALESPYPELAAVCQLNDRAEDAWPALEKHLGRALADLFLTADRRALTPEQSAREKRLKKRLGNLERGADAFREAAREDAAGELARRFADARAQLLETEAQWARFQREMAEAHPVSEGQVFALPRVQAALTPETALIGWLDVPLESGKSLSWGYVVRASGPVRWARLEPLTGREPLELREALCATDGDRSLAAHRRLAQRLWRKRIAPLARALAGVGRLVVIPSGPTSGIPMESLVDDEGRFLADRYTVSYISSGTVYTWLSERSATRPTPLQSKALLVGNPPFSEEQLREMNEGSVAPAIVTASLLRSALSGRRDALGSLPALPATSREVREVANVIGRSRVLLGERASEQELVRLAESGELAEFDVIHFATHALVDDEQPERSALVLSQVGLPDQMRAATAGERIYDGMLTAREILQEWELNAELVTLSACESGLGRELRGEGTVGLAHAFLQAGARSLIVSLWKVDDQATYLLMRRFHENHTGHYDDERGGGTGEAMSKAEALREAKQWLRTRSVGGARKFEHPYFWSSFVLIGDRS